MSRGPGGRTPPPGPPRSAALLLAHGEEEVHRPVGRIGVHRGEDVAVRADRADPHAVPQEETAARLGMNVGALRMALTRLRQRFGAEFRQQVAATVQSGNDRDVDEEIGYLVGLFD